MENPKTRIRQGCPLSPYFFLLVMIVLMHDIEEDPETKERLETHAKRGTICDEILFADDTIIFSEDIKTIQNFLAKIEEKGEYSGLNINKNKSAGIIINPGPGDKI